jgi:hypothetical protein
MKEVIKMEDIFSLISEDSLDYFEEAYVSDSLILISGDYERAMLGLNMIESEVADRFEFEHAWYSEKMMFSWRIPNTPLCIWVRCNADNVPEELKHECELMEREVPASKEYYVACSNK